MYLCNFIHQSDDKNRSIVTLIVYEKYLMICTLTLQDIAIGAQYSQTNQQGNFVHSELKYPKRLMIAVTFSPPFILGWVA